MNDLPVNPDPTEGPVNPDPFVNIGEIMKRMEDLSAHIVIDGEGVITVWNPEAEDLLGWTAAEVIGQPLGEIVVPVGLREAHREGLKKWRETETALVACRRLSTFAIHKDGTSVPIIVSVQVVRDDSGVRFLGWVVRDG